MTEKEFVDRVQSGALLVLGEYRMSKQEMISWRDKQTGRPMSAPVLRHTVEFGDMAVAVSERLPDSITKLEEVPPIPFKKGQRVVLHLDELTRSLGMVAARGRLEPYGANGDNQSGVGQTVGGGAASRKA